MTIQSRTRQKVAETISNSTRTDPVQSRAFVKKAREIEADEDHSRADELLGRLAKMKPEPRSKRQTKK